MRALHGMLLILPTVISPQRISAQTRIWEPLAEGLSVTVWEPGRTCDDQVPPLIAVRIDPERYRFATYHYKTKNFPRPTIKEWQRRTGADLLFNAGLFRDDYSYMGVLLKDGRSLGTKRHAQWQGLFVAEPTAPGLRKARVMDLAVDMWDVDKTAYREVAQSLMLLDHQGKPRVRQTSKRAHQTIVAEDRDGFIVLKTTDAVTLWDLATCLRSGFPAIHQAMVMDGGASSDLLIEGTLPGEAEQGTALSLQSFQDLARWRGDAAYSFAGGNRSVAARRGPGRAQPITSSSRRLDRIAGFDPRVHTAVDIVDMPIA